MGIWEDTEIKRMEMKGKGWGGQQVGKGKEARERVSTIEREERIGELKKGWERTGCGTGRQSKVKGKAIW